MPFYPFSPLATSLLSDDWYTQNDRMSGVEIIVRNTHAREGEHPSYAGIYFGLKAGIIYPVFLTSFNYTVPQQIPLPQYNDCVGSMLY